ncbi:hypothetical protein [Phytobacter diazotrophicus]|uniref:hypothetical protein n=1 Tax=Phytobacter diazotrophicus TaxID=395631 RepID=UPI002FF4DA8D
MSTYKLVSTVKFESKDGNFAKYEIYFDSVSNEHHAEVWHLADVTSCTGTTIHVWHKIPQTIQRLAGNTITDLEHSCRNHFDGK